MNNLFTGSDAGRPFTFTVRLAGRLSACRLTNKINKLN